MIVRARCRSIELRPDRFTLLPAEGHPPVISEGSNEEEPTPLAVIHGGFPHGGDSALLVTYLDAQPPAAAYALDTDKELPAIRTPVLDRVRCKLGYAEQNVVEPVLDLPGMEDVGDEGTRVRGGGWMADEASLAWLLEHGRLPPCFHVAGARVARETEEEGEPMRGSRLVAGLAQLVSPVGDVAPVTGADVFDEARVERVDDSQGVLLGRISYGQPLCPELLRENGRCGVHVHASIPQQPRTPRHLTSYDTELIMPLTVTITGTRSMGHRELAWYTGLFTTYLSPFAGDLTHFHIGGARGIDSLSLLWLAGNSKAKITIVAPGTVSQQPADARQAIQRCRDRISEIVELGAEKLGTAAYHARNRWMVDRSDMAIGFPLEGPEGTSGTWQTLNYAAQQGRSRLIVPV